MNNTLEPENEAIVVATSDSDVISEVTAASSGG